MAEPTKTPEQIEAAKKKEDGKKPLSQAGIDFLTDAVAPKPKEEKPKEPAKAKEGDGKPKDDKPTPALKKAAPAVPAVDYEKLGETVATAVVKATSKKDDKPDKPDDDPVFNEPEAKRNLSKLTLLESVFPDKYKGHADKYKKSLKEWETHADRWEKDHPGETFDEDAAEHKEVRDKLEAVWEYEDDDYIEALADKKADEKSSKRLKEELDPLKGDIEEFKRERRARQEHPKVQAAATAAGNHVWTTLGEDFNGVVKADGTIDTDKLKEISETNPIAHDEAVRAASTVENYSATLYRLSNNLEAFDEKNPTHAALIEFAISSEQRLLSKPVDDQMDDKGRRFVPKVKFDKLNKEERERHWTYNHEDLSFLLASQVAKKAKEIISAEEEKFARNAKARGISYTPRTIKPLSERPVSAEETADETNGKPDSPSTSGASRVAAARNKNNNSQKSNVDTFLSD